MLAQREDRSVTPVLPTYANVTTQPPRREGHVKYTL